MLGGVNVDFPGFYRLLARFAKRKPPAVLLPKPAMMTAAQGAKGVFGALGKEAPVDPAYVEAVVGNYSWYDSGKAVRELGYHITPIETSLAEAVRLARQRLAGTYALNQRIAGKTADGPPPGDDDRLLITGSPGWMGNRLIDILINGDRFGEKYPRRKVRLLQHPSAQGLMDAPPDFEIVYADINDKPAVKKALAGVRAVYHLAGLIYPPKIDLLYTVNTEGTKTLVDACIETGVRRLIYMGTDSICGHGTAEQRRFDENTPATPYKHYGESKYLGEQYVLDKTREGKIDGTSLRGFWFFGPYAPARNMGFVKMFFWPRQIVFGDGQNLAQHFPRGQHRAGVFSRGKTTGDVRQMVLDRRRRGRVHGQSDLPGHRRCAGGEIPAVLRAEVRVRMVGGSGQRDWEIWPYQPDHPGGGEVSLRYRGQQRGGGAGFWVRPASDPGRRRARDAGFVVGQRAPLPCNGAPTAYCTPFSGPLILTPSRGNRAGCPTNQKPRRSRERV